MHRAYDTRKRDRLVALKLLPESCSADDEFRARFRREAEIAATLNEPHVIPIHDYGEIDGRLYLDMRIVNGADLATVLHRDGPFTPERAVAIVEQVAAALDAAHDDGLIHRDVKPSNVLVRPGPPEFAYLVDFGIARPATPSTSGKLTSTGAALGTLDYMAPQQFLGRRLDLFELLTGRAPSSAPPPCSCTPTSPFHHHRRPRTGPHYPQPLDEVVACGMAKDATERHRTANALVVAARAALIPAAAPAPVQAKPDRAPVALLTRPDTTPPPVPVAPARSIRTPATVAPTDVLGPPSPPAREPPFRRRRTGLITTSVLLILAMAAAALVVALRPTPIMERTLTGHTSGVPTVAVGQLDGHPVVVSGSAGGTVRVWDMATRVAS